MRAKNGSSCKVANSGHEVMSKSSTSTSKEKFRFKPITFVERGLTTVPSIVPTNLLEQKDKFLKEGKTPNFVINADAQELEDLTTKSKGQIRFDLLAEAEHVLETVREQYGEGDNFLNTQFGPRISKEEATEKLAQYLDENALNESLTVVWCHDLPCSARMMWQGPYVKSNRPEARKYSLWLNSSLENPYIRSDGITSILDHEVGTHFCRMYNDGLQPWYSDRQRFGLRGMNSYEGMCTEEGLAAINTIFRSNMPFLWLPALTYYTACKSAEMTFKELFNHLGRFLHNPEQRWKHVVRVKRGLQNPNDVGGYGKDQCYFEGAVQILRGIDNIDFHLLMAGKICLDEQNRVKRVARQDCLKMPAFMRDLARYKQKLRRIAVLNDLHLHHAPRFPPPAYLLRLEERRNRVRPADSGEVHRHRKVRKRRRFAVSSFLPSASASESDTTITPINGDNSVAHSEIDIEDYEKRTGSLVSAASPACLHSNLLNNTAYPSSPRGGGRARFLVRSSPDDNCSNNEAHSLQLQHSRLSIITPDEIGDPLPMSPRNNSSSQTLEPSSSSPSRQDSTTALASAGAQGAGRTCKSLVKSRDPPKCSERILSFIYPNDTEFELHRASLPLLSKPPKSGRGKKSLNNKNVHGWESEPQNRSSTPVLVGSETVIGRKSTTTRLLSKRAQSAGMENFDERFSTQA